MPHLTLTKHHGLGNDFLVLVDDGGGQRIDAGLARTLCDRHRGVGADGLLRASAGTGGADLTFELRNADGSEAEMSGNGMRCLVQAALDAGLVSSLELVVATPSGLRRVTASPESAPGRRTVSVDMGVVEMGPDQPQDFPDRKVRAVRVGNPHLVLLGPDDLDGLDVATLGPQLEAGVPGGVNVEFAQLGPLPDEVTMRVWERGVGETLACGTGATAVASAVHSWGLAGERIVVHQRGGAAQVELHDDAVVLTGPTQRIARIEVELPQ